MIGPTLGRVSIWPKLKLFNFIMSHLSRIFESAPVKVQNKNGFDLSHLNCGTAKTGQLVPVMCKLLPPNSDFTLGISLNVELPPLATNFMGRVDAIVEGFIVPCSVLYGGWKQFISNQQDTMFPSSQASISPDGSVDSQGFRTKGFELPRVVLYDAQFLADYLPLYRKNNNIAEYFGVRVDEFQQISEVGPGYELNLLPLLAYHLIWDVFYRNKQVTKTIFAVNPNVSTASDLNKKNVSLIWHSFYSQVSGGPGLTPYFTTTAQLTFPDGVSIFSTRQRNYARDYFTAATLSPQQGMASRLRFDVADGEGEFTIASLRAANALQKFLETNNLSADYADMMRNRWGVRPVDADFDEPYYLGRVVLPVYQKSVFQQQASGVESPSSNPFVSGGMLGAKGASGSFVGEGSIADKFHNSTWAYLMCLFSLVPHAAYGYGINRELLAVNLGDFPAPELQTVGNEEIKSFELLVPGVGTDPDSFDATFGYIPRYSRFKYMDDEIHGELRPGKTLESFVLQRRLVDPGDGITLTSSFLEIPQNALDSVFAVSTEEMNLSCWYEIYFKFKVSMPLADFCIPTLGDIQDTHTIKTSVGGSRL